MSFAPPEPPRPSLQSVGRAYVATGRLGGNWGRGGIDSVNLSPPGMRLPLVRDREIAVFIPPLPPFPPLTNSGDVRPRFALDKRSLRPTLISTALRPSNGGPPWHTT